MRLIRDKFLEDLFYFGVVKNVEVITKSLSCVSKDPFDFLGIVQIFNFTC